MTWRDHEGVEWVPASVVLERVPGLNGWTLRSWLRPRTADGVPKVRSHRVGRQVWVAWEDVLTVEAAAHLAGWRRGRRARDLP